MTAPNAPPVQVEVGSRGLGRVLVGTTDIANVVEGLQLTVVGGRSSRLSLSLRIERPVHTALGRHEVYLDEPTREALVLLGWTPPEHQL